MRRRLDDVASLAAPTPSSTIATMLPLPERAIPVTRDPAEAGKVFSDHKAKPGQILGFAFAFIGLPRTTSADEQKFLDQCWNKTVAGSIILLRRYWRVRCANEIWIKGG